MDVNRFSSSSFMSKEKSSFASRLRLREKWKEIARHLWLTIDLARFHDARSSARFLETSRLISTEFHLDQCPWFGCNHWFSHSLAETAQHPPQMKLKDDIPRILSCRRELSLYDVVGYTVPHCDRVSLGLNMDQSKMKIVSSHYAWHNFGECIIV